jgi:CRP-like cAMP-binding protein
MPDALIRAIQQHVRLSEHDEALCRQHAETVQAERGTVLEQAGAVPRHLYFVVSGYVRLFGYNDAGEEVTSHLNCPPGFITSYQAFTQQTPAPDSVECVTDCQLVRIRKSGLEALIRESPALQAFGVAIFEQAIAYNEQRARQLATLSATERYRRLLEQQPDILQHVPLQHIASFLGMNPKSLSRIRRQPIR